MRMKICQINNCPPHHRAVKMTATISIQDMEVLSRDWLRPRECPAICLGAARAAAPGVHRCDRGRSLKLAAEAQVIAARWDSCQEIVAVKRIVVDEIVPIGQIVDRE